MPRKYQLQGEANNARFCVSATNVNTIYQEQFQIDSFWIGEDIVSQSAHEWARWTSKWQHHAGAWVVGNSPIAALAPVAWEWGRASGFKAVSRFPLAKKNRQGYNYYITLCQVLKSRSYNLSKICEGPSALGQ